MENKNKSKAAIIRSIVETAKGNFFTIKFIKKNGDERVMNCRTGVTKHLAGGKRTVPEDKIVVFDMQKEAYRCFDPSTVSEIHIGGEVIKFA